MRGDATDTESLAEAVRGCELVFNAMGLPEQWLADPLLFHDVDARGSENLARAARGAGVRRWCTQTIDVFHAERGSAPTSRAGRLPEGHRTSAPSRRPSGLCSLWAAASRRRW